MPVLLKRILFRVHWISGLTAGLVLAVVGATGALIGFEHELVALINPELRIAAHEGVAPKTPDALIAAARAAHPDYGVRGLAWNGDDEAVTVRMARGRERGGLEVAVDPYTGAVLGTPRGTRFFEGAEQLHRNLAAGPAGKQVVGASTAILVALAITGLVLRWPRRPLTLAPWLRLHLRLRGRPLLWNLHSVVATWVLPLYLVAALTGLWWSYDFYRDAVNRMAGVTQPVRRPQPPDASAAPPASLDAAWATFRKDVADATAATAMLPRDASAPVEIRYQTPSSPHGRAWNTLKLDAATGAIASRELYAEQPAGRRFVSSLFPLHSGEFFGWPGRVAMAIASLLMPLFAVTGIWMWLGRRRAERARPAPHADASSARRVAAEAASR